MEMIDLRPRSGDYEICRANGVVASPCQMPRVFSLTPTLMCLQFEDKGDYCNRETLKTFLLTVSRS